ncbi:MAG TPA: ribosome small subunit-dependent GTPase A [Limnobacter sp.]|nr:ribosome small subunit-dependent GTPase A [Limnobacter sp.]
MAKFTPHKNKPGQPTKNANSATVVASYGRHFVARDAQGLLWQVYGKGKRREVAVGDVIAIEPSGDRQAWIDEIEHRRNLLYRSDALKSKMFAANLDQVMLVLAVSPPYSPELLGRTWVACQHAGIPLHIVFNKSDLLAEDPELAQTLLDELQDWTVGQSQVHMVSVTTQPKACEALLQPLVMGKRTLILGQSGMGKSTLINLLIPSALAATNDISIALNAGKHTTTHTQLHAGEGFELIDSPGFQAFGLHHLSTAELLALFEDIQDTGRQCRFANCQHLKEPGCAVKEALEQGSLHAGRFELYQLLKAELEASSRNY